MAAAILYEDDHLLAVDKPAGLVVHPTYKHPTETLLDQLAPSRAAAPLAIVGRLDKQTSGVVIVAKGGAMHAKLQRAMAADDCEKRYLAIVYGLVPDAHGEIALRLRINPEDRRVVVASRDVGAPSLTRFTRLATVSAADTWSLLECRPVTGRRHQIRVHLAASGWPIAGDATYGEPMALVDSDATAALRAFGRQSLHAASIALTHPIMGNRLVVTSPVPADFCDLLAALRFSQTVLSPVRCAL